MRLSNRGKIYDPLLINAVPPNSSFHPETDSVGLEKTLKSIALEYCKQRSRPLGAHLGRSARNSPSRGQNDLCNARLPSPLK
jgi:hypothetical protein